MRSQYDLRFQAPDEKYDLAGRAEPDGSVLDPLSEKAILLQVTMPKHRRNLPHSATSSCPLKARSKRLLNTIALISPFETHQVL